MNAPSTCVATLSILWHRTHVPRHPCSFLKELESTKKKQSKELASVVKSQCTSIEKAAKGKTFNTVEEVIT